MNVNGVVPVAESEKLRCRNQVNRTENIYLAHLRIYRRGRAQLQIKCIKQWERVQPKSSRIICNKH